MNTKVSESPKLNFLHVSAQERGARSLLKASALSSGIWVETSPVLNWCPKNLKVGHIKFILLFFILNPSLPVAKKTNSKIRRWSLDAFFTFCGVKTAISSIYNKIHSSMFRMGHSLLPGEIPFILKKVRKFS